MVQKQLTYTSVEEDCSVLCLLRSVYDLVELAWISISVLNEYRIQAPSTWLANTDGLYVAAGNNEDDEIDLFTLLDATPAEDQAQAAALLANLHFFSLLEFINLHLMGVQLC